MKRTLAEFGCEQPFEGKTFRERRSINFRPSLFSDNLSASIFANGESLSLDLTLEQVSHLAKEFSFYLESKEAQKDG